MDIKNINNIILFDSIEKISRYKDNWNNSEKEIPLYSLYFDYFKTNKYYLYVGIASVIAKHVLHYFMSFKEGKIRIETLLISRFELLNNNLLIIREKFNYGSKVLKRVPENMCNKYYLSAFNILKDSKFNSNFDRSLEFATRVAVSYDTLIKLS